MDTTRGWSKAFVCALTLCLSAIVAFGTEQAAVNSPTTDNSQGPGSPRSAGNLSAASNSASPGSQEEAVLGSHIGLLNELSERRRLNIFFRNEQSAFHGVPARFVNSSQGNLTFVRRDLVAIGRIPLVLARSYDSSVASGADFGPGWRLTLAETIERRRNGILLYVDDSGSEWTFAPSAGGKYVLDPAGPTDIAFVESLESGGLRMSYRTGWTKIFTGGTERFHLTQVRDTHGNELRIRHDRGLLERIEGDNGRFVKIARDEIGRVSSATDDQGRHVSYIYDRSGRLTQTIDLGGNLWDYRYDKSGRLKSALDSNGNEMLSAVYGSGGKATAIRILGAGFRYVYKGRVTSIKDEAGKITRIEHAPSGIATSITNAEGLRSEIRLDARNRVTTLLHNDVIRAEFFYDSSGRIESIRRHENDATVSLAYVRDAEGRVTKVTGSDGSRLELAYNTAGDLTRRTQGDQEIAYAYTDRGDLESVTQAGRSVEYSHDKEGQVETITGTDGSTVLTYFQDGKVRSIQFADGSLHEYRHSRLGFREHVERSDGSQMSYEYDFAGNLIRTEGTNADGRNTSVAIELDDYHRPTAIDYPDGKRMSVSYDAQGNPLIITQSSDQSPEAAPDTVEYLYDSTNRVVAVQDGESIAGSHAYEETEADLRTQRDERTMRVAATSVRQSASVGDLASIVYTRPTGSLFDVVRYDEPTRTIDLPTVFGLTLPDAVPLNSLTRRKLPGSAVMEQVQERVNFDRPSNVVWLPREYDTINCLPPGCVFNGITLRANNQQNTLIVPAGTTVNFRAMKVGTSCARVLYTFYQDSLFTAANLTGMLARTYLVPGTYEMMASGECLGCDLIRAAFVTVIVTPSSTPGPPPSCTPFVTQQAAINSVFEWPKKEPFERGVTLVCVGIDVITPQRPTTSWTTTQDPCATGIQLVTNWVAAAHSHPFFTTAAQYRAGVGCFGDNETSPTGAQLDQLNIDNQEFSDGDRTGFCFRTEPLYMRVPLGDRVKRLQGSEGGACSTTTVFP